MRFSAASNFFFSAFVLSFYIARFTDLLSLFCVALHVALNVTWILFCAVCRFAYERHVNRIQQQLDHIVTIY